MTRHEPRPALQRSADGSVHPAAPRNGDDQKGTSGRKRKTSSGNRPLSLASTSDRGGSPADYGGKPVRLSVEVPKKLRKAIRDRAEQGNQTLDEVVTAALVSYLTGNSDSAT